MKIKSNFRDFYDSLQGLYQDDLLYLRKEEVINDRFPSLDLFDTDLHKFSQYLIGFSGKWYFILHTFKRVGRPYEYKWELDKILVSYDQICEYFKDSKKFNSRSWLDDRVQYFTGTKFGLRRYLDYLLGYNSEVLLNYPIIVQKTVDIGYRHRKEQNTLVNCKLGDIGFPKIVEPYSAFQELRMWLCNQANPEKPIPKIDDVTMAESKGFDRFSFRKPKSV